MRILSHIFLFSLLLIGNSCKKNNSDDELPPLTFEGKNTIGCKINGQVWVPKGRWSGSIFLYPMDAGGLYVDPFYPNVHLLIETNDPGSEIELFCRNYSGNKFLPVGKYYFNRTTQTINGYFEKHSYGYLRMNGNDYLTDSLHNGWIEILKLDTTSRIISGRFEFDAYNSSDGKTIKITDGRFDIK